MAILTIIQLLTLMNLWQAIEFGRLTSLKINNAAGIIFIILNLVVYIPVLLYVFYIIKFFTKKEDTLDTRKNLYKACTLLLAYTIVNGLIWAIFIISLFSGRGAFPWPTFL